MIDGVRRNYRVVGLCRHSDQNCYTVMVLRAGTPDPTDTGPMVGEFIDPDQLHRGGVFGYFRRPEVQIFRRGLSKTGLDVDPRTRKPRRKG